MKHSKELAEAIEFSYREDYSNIVNSGGYLSRLVYKKSHESLEKFASAISGEGKAILELGAQADQHRAYVKEGYDLYIVSDLNIELLESNLENPDRINNLMQNSTKVKYERIDAMSIPYPENSFDRVLATCLIAHLSNPVDALQEWRRVVRPGGQIDFYVACEPGIALRLARVLTHKRTLRRSTYEYDLLQYSMHVNHFPAINEFVKFAFSRDKVKRQFFPFRLPSWNINFWAIYSIKVSK